MTTNSVPFSSKCVAKLWRSVCGVTLPSERSSFATSTARAKPFFTDLTPAPCHSTKWLAMIFLSYQRRMWTSRRSGSGTVG